MIRLEKFLVLIGLEMREGDGIEVTIIKAFALDDLIKGVAKSDINAMDKWTFELNFKVTAFTVFQTLLFVGGNKGEIQYFDFNT